MDIKDYIIPSRGQSPFIDVQLKQHAYKKFAKRAISDIGAASTHQVAAGSSFVGIACYHVSRDNHICSDGCPGINYHIGIEKDGTIYQLNDLTNVVYSSGKKKSYRLPSQADCFSRWGKYFNKYSIGILVRGNFDGPGYKGSEEPTPEQIEGLHRVANWATQEAKFFDNKPIELRNFLGHCHVNKNACPGFILQEWIEQEVWTGKFLEEKPRKEIGLGTATGEPPTPDALANMLATIAMLVGPGMAPIGLGLTGARLMAMSEEEKAELARETAMLKAIGFHPPIDEHPATDDGVNDDLISDLKALVSDDPISALRALIEERYGG